MQVNDTQANLKPLAASAIGHVIASLEPEQGCKFLRSIAGGLIAGDDRTLCEDDGPVSHVVISVTVGHVMISMTGRYVMISVTVRHVMISMTVGHVMISVTVGHVMMSMTVRHVVISATV